MAIPTGIKYSDISYKSEIDHSIEDNIKINGVLYEMSFINGAKEKYDNVFSDKQIVGDGLFMEGNVMSNSLNNYIPARIEDNNVLLYYIGNRKINDKYEKMYVINNPKFN